MRLAFIIVESHLSKREETQDRSMSNLGAQVNECIYYATNLLGMV